MSAVLSPCGTYRYRLRRDLGQGKGTLLWLMLNPSKADATINDPTIRKVIGFTRRMGYETALVGNLFAWRATDPKDLARAVKQWGLPAVIGPGNTFHVEAMLLESDAVVLAWGGNGAKYPSVVRAMRQLCARAELGALPKRRSQASFDGRVRRSTGLRSVRCWVYATLSIWLPQPGPQALSASTSLRAMRCSTMRVWMRTGSASSPRAPPAQRAPRAGS